MIETSDKTQDTDHVHSVKTETVLHDEPELLLPIDEYANRHDISRRTVDRYVKLGRLEATKKLGRTMIVDKPLKPFDQDKRQGKSAVDSQIVQFAYADLIRYGSLLTRSKAKTIWQIYAIVVSILLFAFVLAFVCVYMQLRFVTL